MGRLEHLARWCTTFFELSLLLLLSSGGIGSFLGCLVGCQGGFFFSLFDQDSRVFALDKSSAAYMSVYDL